MSWIKLSEELYLSDQSPYSLEKIDGIWYVVDNSTQKKSIPFTDIFNNPVFPIDYSNTDMIVKSLTSPGTVEGKHIRGESANAPGTPAFSFQGDINSGIYRIDADRVGFSAGGSRQGEFGVGYGGFTGNIIQAQFGSLSTSISTTNTTFQATGLNVSITPKYNNSKILIFGNCQGLTSPTSYISLRLVRDGSQIYYILDTGFNSVRSGSAGFSFLDSPASILTLNYAIQYKVYAAGTAYFNDFGTNNALSTIVALEIQQ